LCRIFVLLLLISFSLLGCNNVTPSEELRPWLYQESKGNIAIELKFKYELFNLGDEIAIAATATNTSDKVIQYESGSSTCPVHISLSVVSKETGRELVSKPSDETRECTTDVNVTNLKPGESISETKVFLAREWAHAEQEQAYGGEYEVEASLRIPEGVQGEAISVKTSILIHGTSVTTISAEHAENAAINQEKTKRWILMMNILR